MIKFEIEKAYKNLVNKKLIRIEYFDKEKDKDSCLKVYFSNSYILIIYTFWRIMDFSKIIAIDTERYLLPNCNAPKNDYENLPFNESLLYRNLEFLKTRIVNSIVEDVIISETNDITIKFNNSLIIQGIINCRCNSYMYYGLFQGNQEILKVCFDWNLCE